MLRRIAGSLFESILILVLVLPTVAPAAAAEFAPAGKWAVLTFEPAQTTIGFKLSGWPHSPHGTFKLKRGVIRLDPASGKMQGAIVIDAASGDSGNSLRDSRMTNSILDAPHFPDITFVPDQLESHGSPPGEFPAVVRGVMKLHGAQHPFTIVARVRREGDNATINCDFIIPYVAWGMENPSVLFLKVSNTVDIHVSATVHLAWVSAP